MTPGQTRVLVLLACLLGLQTLDNATFRNNLVTWAKGELPTHTLGAGLIGWSAAGVALVALAAPAPRIATWVVVIFIAMNLLEHADAWSGALNTVSNGFTQLTSTSLVNGSIQTPSAASQQQHRG